MISLHPSQVCAGDLFDSLSNEDEQKVVRRPEKVSSELEDAVEGFWKFVDPISTAAFPCAPHKISHKTLQKFVEFTKGLNIDGERDYYGAYMGLLINHCRRGELAIDIRESPLAMEAFGYKTRDKSVSVTGDLGYNAFNSAKNAKLRISGNVGNKCLNGAKKCKASIRGNVGDELGVYSENCIIWVEGTVHGIPGIYMKGSKIYVKGNVYGTIERTDFIIHGELFIDGDLIIPESDEIGEKMELEGLHITGNIRKLPDDSPHFI